jgi:IclR-like helix-turn-helix domain-containing protein
LRPAAPTRSAEIAQIGPLGKPVGAVVAAAKVLRVLHASERPLNASEVARAAALHRGTAYNILRTLQAESFVGYDEATRTYTVSLRILELAYGVLRRSGLLDIARPCGLSADRTRRRYRGRQGVCAGSGRSGL